MIRSVVVVLSGMLRNQNGDETKKLLKTCLLSSVIT